MTQEEIIEMAEQAGFEILYGWPDSFYEFAKLVAQHERERIKKANAPEIERVNAHIKQLEDAVLAEREACAKVCDEVNKEYDGEEVSASWIAVAIRARGDKK